jgi:acetyltransferase-like isoleucine patch superfamily enzyme
MKKLFKLYLSEGIVNSLHRILHKIGCHFRGLIFINSSATIGRNFKMIGKQHIKFGKNNGFGDLARIELYSNYLNQDFNPSLKIGDNSSFGYALHIGVISKVSIGKNVLGGSNILIIDHNHGDIFNIANESNKPPAYRDLISMGDIYIGDNVWIGDNVKIFSGAHIGDGCIIAANAVVSKKMESNSLCFDQNKTIL